MMWPFTRQHQPGLLVSLKITGMHCSSCALTIDETLEELPGVYQSRTSYARAIVAVRVDPTHITPAQVVAAIEGLGYEVQAEQQKNPPR